MSNRNASGLQRDYDDLTVELSDLPGAIIAAENDAATARAEADECTDGAGVLAAMAEERAARNRVALLRRRQVEAQRERNQISVELERMRLTAVAGLVEEARSATGAALVAVYQDVIAARDRVEAAQRDAGAMPVDSPFDSVCGALESALHRAGATVIPDSSSSVTVMYGDFVYVRRPIGWQPPQPRRKFPKVQMNDLEALRQRLSARPTQENW
jgi:hypothetical protein